MEQNGHGIYILVTHPIHPFFNRFLGPEPQTMSTSVSVFLVALVSHYVNSLTSAPEYTTNNYKG